ncbi:hypothetical protein MASR2M50_12960 [Thauera sp.]
MLARQHQAIGEGGVHVDLLDVAGELARAGELQQLGDDQPDASDLLVDQADLVGHRLRRRAKLVAQQVEVALDHRRRVADLVCNAGGELADRSELLAHHQAALRGAQLLVRSREVGGALGDLAVERGVERLQLGAARGLLVEQTVEGGGEPAKLVSAGEVAHARTLVAGVDAADGGVHPLDRAKDAARPIQRQQGAGGTDQQRERADHQQCHALGGAERGLEKADIEHADAIPAAVEHRFVGRHVPVVDHEGGLQPGPAVVEHVRAHLVRGARAEGARALEQAHVGGDAHVVDEQRGRALAALGQACRRDRRPR